jgi:hypothetical protein
MRLAGVENSLFHNLLPAFLFTEVSHYPTFTIASIAFCCSGVQQGGVQMKSKEKLGVYL